MNISEDERVHGATKMSLVWLPAPGILLFIGNQEP